MQKKNIINYKNYEIIWKGKEWKQIWINECNKKRRKMRERKVWVEYRKNKNRKDRKLVTVNGVEAQKERKKKIKEEITDVEKWRNLGRRS